MMWDGIRKAVRARPALAAALAAVVVLLSAPSLSAAQTVPAAVQSTVDDQTFAVRYTATFSEDALTFGTLLGYDTVRLEDCDSLSEPGQPRLPAQTVRIALPAGMAVTGVRLVEAQSLALEGQYTIFPAQPPRHVSAPATGNDFVPPDARTYASSVAYPGRLVEFTHQTDLAGQGIALLRFYPVQYVPAEQKLTLHTRIAVVLEGVGGYRCGDYLPRRISPGARAVYQRMIADMVVNPDDVALRVSDEAIAGARGVGSGDHDYVIITQSDWVDDFQPLADWKTKKGTPANIVTTDWIYDGGAYSGSQQDMIRSFVVDAHNNWGTTFFLLGGDTDIVPPHSRSMGDDDIPNDTYYADYDDDWTCEIHVGRAAVRNTSEISTFINKALTYEKNPPLSEYAKTAAYFGFDLYEYGSAEGEDCKEDIRTLYTHPSFTVRTEYDSEPGSHKADAIAYLNQGNNLVNHIDHSSTYVMGVGSTNHGDYLHNSDMSALTNGDRQSIFYSIGCWPCNYADDTCIGEAFVRNSAGGGVAFVGNSRYGWYTPYQDDTHSHRFDRQFYRSIFWSEHYELGVAFSDHKNDAIMTWSDTHKYIFTELTLLGDPQLPILTEDPQSLSVAHDESLTAGELATFPVGVDCGGSPLLGATVCLWKDGDVYEVAETNGSGQASFSFTPGSSGPLYVTVTCRNYLPYEGQATVEDAPVYELGDLNCDGSVDGFDIDAFILAVLSTPPEHTEYYAEYPDCDVMLADCDGSGHVDGFDIDAFVSLLTK